MTVIGLGAWCDYENEDGDAPVHSSRRTVSIRIEEFAVLSDGRRLSLKGESVRGYGSSLHNSAESEPVDIWAHVTLDSIDADVRTTVLPDGEDTEDEHPWGWLADRLRSHNVEVTAEQLKQLPYDVEFSERLRARLRST